MAKFECEGLRHQGRGPLLILGPCVIEEEGLTREIAREVRDLGDSLEAPVIFKASFDKANRSSLNSYRGPGLEKGLAILDGIRRDFGIPVLTDVHETAQVPAVGEVVSVVQIPAFLARQTDLLVAAGRTGKPVNIKKGQFMAAEDMRLAVEKVRAGGDVPVWLTERGTSLGYRNLVVDFRNIPLMQRTGCPVILDATHGVQRPSAGEGVSGGDPEFIPLLARAGVACGVDGLFMEVHPEPRQALSDGANSLPLDALRPLLERLLALYNLR